jgi:4-methylaminobutanoate oxidase (formaldehyde-forming)
LLHDEPIYQKDKIVGYTTSSNYSFCYNKNICLGYVKGVENDSNDLFIEVEGKRYALYLEKTPIHDPSSKLMRI